MSLEGETDQDFGSGGTMAPRYLRSPSAVNQTQFRSGQKGTNRLAIIQGRTLQKLKTWIRGTHMFEFETKKSFGFNKGFYILNAGITMCL
jgi:hypothetical protein